MTRGSEEKNLSAGGGKSALGAALFFDKKTIAEIEAKSPEFSVICVGETEMEYTCLALGWVLLLVELPQPASRPANPIRTAMKSRFIVGAYLRVIQTGVAPAPTEAGLSARSLPVFWSNANWKILAAFVSST